MAILLTLSILQIGKNMGIYMKAIRHGPRRSYSIDLGCYATMFALLIKIKNISC